jgi:hypothetical protein
MSDLASFSFYLGIKVQQGDSGIMLRQTDYVKRVIELVGLTDCNPTLTPMDERLKLSHDRGGGCYAVQVSYGEPLLPHPHTVGLDILCRLC